MNTNSPQHKRGREQEDISPLSINELTRSLNTDDDQTQKTTLIGELFRQIDSFDTEESTSDLDRSHDSPSPTKRRKARKTHQSIVLRSSLLEDKGHLPDTAKLVGGAPRRWRNAIPVGEKASWNPMSQADLIRYKTGKKKDPCDQASETDNQGNVGSHRQYDNNVSHSTLPPRRYVGQSSFEEIDGKGIKQMPTPHGRPFTTPRQAHELQNPHQARARSVPPKGFSSSYMTHTTPALPTEPVPPQRPFDTPQSILLPPGMQVEVGGRTFNVGLKCQSMSPEQARRFLESFRSSQNDSAKNPQSPSSAPSRPW